VSPWYDVWFDDSRCVDAYLDARIFEDARRRASTIVVGAVACRDHDEKSAMLTFDQPSILNQNPHR